MIIMSEKEGELRNEVPGQGFENVSFLVNYARKFLILIIMQVHAFNRFMETLMTLS